MKFSEKYHELFRVARTYLGIPATLFNSVNINK